MISKIYKGFALLVLSAAVFCGCGGKQEAKNTSEPSVSVTAPTEAAEQPETKPSEPAVTKEPAAPIESSDSLEHNHKVSIWKENPPADGMLDIPKIPMPDFAAVDEQYEAQRDEITDGHETFVNINGLTAPCISIFSESEKEILSKEEYVACVVDVFNCGEEYALSANAGVKVRGNSSANKESELPYRIKFEKKQGMLGLHDGKEFKNWVLLRTFWNLASDYMDFSLAKTIFEGRYYSSDSCFVHLIVNNEYKGIYLLCEQNQAAKGRIEIAEAKEGEIQTDIGYLLEMDNYPGEEHPYFIFDHLDTEITDVRGVSSRTWQCAYSVKSDINTMEQLEYIEKYTGGCFKILYEAVENNKPMMFDEELNVVPAEGTYATPEEAVRAVMDVDSLANMMILMELVFNLDTGNGSVYMAVDFSEDSLYDRLTFMAPWDCNWAYVGDPDDTYKAVSYQLIRGDLRRSNLWYILAYKADWFREIIEEKWNRLKPGIEETVTQVEKNCEALENDLGFEKQKLEEARDIFDFVRGRIKWLDGEWGEKKK